MKIHSVWIQRVGSENDPPELVVACDEETLIMGEVEDIETQANKEIESWSHQNHFINIAKRRTIIFEVDDKVLDQAFNGTIPITVISSEETKSEPIQTNETHEYPVTIDLTLPVNAPSRYQDLSHKESERGGRVIGGDRGDLIFQGYSVSNSKAETVLSSPVVKTGWKNLSQDEVNEIATEILWASYNSVGMDCILSS